jgi:predicted nucleotidyltransferase
MPVEVQVTHAPVTLAQYNRHMGNARVDPTPFESERWYRGDEVPKSAIRRFARQVAQRFRPDKIILFGSHAYGTPGPDSDVDILVIMPARNQLDQAFRIRLAVPAPFPIDLIVRTPKKLQWWLDEGESFHTEIVSRGTVLYAKDHRRVGAKGRGRLARRRTESPPEASRP